MKTIIPVDDQSKTFKVAEWLVWKTPYQRLIATWEEE